MTRVEAYRILEKLWCDATPEQAEAIRMAQNDLEFVDLMPDDTVAVVRCKDCAYSKDAKVNDKGFLVCPASGMEITDEDYCSYGERKENVN